MIPSNITKDHILQAIQKIESSVVPPTREPDVYDLLLENGKHYPLKYVISVASEIAGNKELNGGEFKPEEMKAFFKKIDLKVVRAESLPNSIIIAKIAWSYNGWIGFDEEGYKNRNKYGYAHIKKFGLAHEWWSFHDFGGGYYFGHIETGERDVRAFKNNGLILITSVNPDKKQFNLIGFYGKAEHGDFSLPMNLWDIISSEDKDQLTRDALGGLIDKTVTDELKERTTLHWRGRKEFSTIFKKYIPFNPKEFGVPIWGRAPYIGIGKTPGKFTKDQTKNLLMKALDEHKSLLPTASGKEKEDIESVIEKTGKVLDMYFDNSDSRNYWQIAPGPGASSWPLCTEKGIIPIFFTDTLGTVPDDILSYSREQLIEHCKKHNTAQLSDGKISARVDAIWGFLHTVQTGDYILANKGQSVAVGWGIVRSDAKICRDDSTITFYRTVDWKDPQLNRKIDPELGRHFFTTIMKLKKEQFDSVVLSSERHDRAYWVIPPLSDNFERFEVWNKWKEYGTVNIVWSELARKLGNKLLEFSTYGEFRDAYHQVYSGQPDMVWKFIHEMKEGDIILACMGHTKILGRGTVKSPVKIYNDTFRDSPEKHDFFSDLPIYRDVEWEEFSPEVPVPQEISRLCSRGVKRLSQENYDKIFSKGPAMVENPLYSKIQNILDYKKQVILYGPPGTGKTWTVSNFVESKKRAEPKVKILTTDKNFFWFSANPARWDPNNLWKGGETDLWYGSIRSAFNDIEEGDIVFTYVSKDHHRIFGIATCSRKEFDNNNIPKVYIRGIQPVKGPEWSEMKEDPVLSNAKPVRMGARGTLFPLDQYESLHLLEMAGVSPGSIGITVDEQEERIENCIYVTFHPSYSYEEFIEGLRPEKDENGNIYYKVQEGIFKQACRTAYNALLREAKVELEWDAEGPLPHLSEEENQNVQEVVNQAPIYFIIDEINRGDISRIFGELITLIEADKRLFMSTKIPCTLPYSKQEFGIPPNLYIIGTMNTADRSISLMDVALRRRFGFCELMPEYDALETVLLEDSSIEPAVKETRQLAIDVLKAINNRLQEKYDRDHQIGHSYFIKLSDNDTPDGSLSALENIWKYEILPLLQEYFFDSPEKLLYVLNDRFYSSNGISFVEKPEENFISALRAVAQQKSGN